MLMWDCKFDPNYHKIYVKDVYTFIRLKVVQKWLHKWKNVLGVQNTIHKNLNLL